MDQHKYIDLHTHTTESDGSMTPTELVRHAFEQGLCAVAVTDHDTVKGVEQAIEEGKRLGIEVIPGVEISVDLSQREISLYPPSLNPNQQDSSADVIPEMHLLGYFFRNQYDSIRNTLEQLRDNREQRNPRIVHKLNELGFAMDMEEVTALAAGGVVGRPHIARVMVDKGYVASVEEAFEKYLANGRPAYFRKDKLTPEEGISEIFRAGGVPVLAHPIYLYMNIEQLDHLLGQLVEIGLKGIEAYYTDNTEKQTADLLMLAEKHHLLVTGGSDFHGSFKPDIEIGRGRGGLRVAYNLLQQLKQA